MITLFLSTYALLLLFPCFFSARAVSVPASARAYPLLPACDPQTRIFTFPLDQCFLSPFPETLSAFTFQALNQRKGVERYPVLEAGAVPGTRG